MNKVSEQLNGSFVPFMAMIAYKSHDDFYLESHPINKDGQMLEGRPLKVKTLEAIANSIFDNNAGKVRLSGYIPENLLKGESEGSGEYSLVWYRKEEQRTIHFSSSLEMDSGLAYVPATVYSATKSGLKVFALKSNKRPTEDTQLYRAPYYNVTTESVCLGNAKVKKPDILSFSNIMKYWEDMFWLSEFSAMHGGNFCKSNGNLVWKRMIQNPSLKWSSINELVSHQVKISLKSIL